MHREGRGPAAHSRCPERIFAQAISARLRGRLVPGAEPWVDGHHIPGPRRCAEGGRVLVCLAGQLAMARSVSRGREIL